MLIRTFLTQWSCHDNAKNVKKHRAYFCKLLSYGCAPNSWSYVL